MFPGKNKNNHENTNPGNFFQYHHSFRHDVAKSFFRYAIGMARGELANLKDNMFAGNAEFGGEFKIARKSRVEASVGIENINFSYSDQLNNHVYNTRSNIIIQGKVKQPVFARNKRSYFFYAIGLWGNFALKDKKEIFKSESKTVINQKVKGYNLAFLADIGHEFILSEKVKFSLSLLTQNDFHKKYSSRSDEIKYGRILLSMGWYYKFTNRKSA